MSEHTKSGGPNSVMLFKTFVEITEKEIQNNDTSGFVPILLIQESRAIKALEGIPSETNHENEVRQWVVESISDGQECFVAYKGGEGKVLIEWHKNGLIFDAQAIET